jgi:hypothetical protein
MKTSKARRGGIRKRGPTRTDRDGDMDMDAGGSRVKRGRTEKSGLGGRIAGAGVGGRAAGTGSRVPARDKQLDLIQRAISSVDPQANIRQGNRKTTTELEQFSVRGWKSSKAASNRDGGVESLIAFLERRMNSFIKSGPRAKITKVSPHCLQWRSPPTSHPGRPPHSRLLLLFFRLVLLQDDDRPFGFFFR